jgi:DNA-binding CsgD family transcriptional regulator
MANNEFIIKTIAAAKVIFHADELYYIIDDSYKVQHCSESYAKYLGFNSAGELNKLIVDDNSLNHYFGISASEPIKLSENNSPHVYLVFVNDIHNAKKPFFSVVRSIIDDNKNIIGYFINNITAFFNADKLQLLEKLNPNFSQKSYRHKNKNPVALSRREEEVLFLLLYGKSAREITEFINKAENNSISVNTIKSIINKQLFFKFDVYDLDELLIKAKAMGYASIIPASFIIENRVHMCS